MSVHGEGIEMNEVKNISLKRWKLNAVDADGIVVTIRLDSTLMAEGKFLSPGAIFKSTDAFPLYLNYGDDYCMKCGIVVREFAIVGRAAVPSMPKGAPTRLEVEKQRTDESKKRKKSSVCPDDCDGKLCSVFNLNFIMCILKCVPIDKVPLEKVAAECVFVTMEYKDMLPKNKRFLLYYYSATSVYQFHGAGNRITLPSCLVAAIRAMYPDEK